MRKFYFNKPFLFSLITALLFLQWSATHIHLAGEHEHDAVQHQHAATVHQHQITSHHEDVIDIASDTFSHIDSSKVIELEHVCTQFHGNLDKLFVVIPVGSTKSFERQNASNRLVIDYQKESYQSFHQYSSIRLRAPPVVS